MDDGSRCCSRPSAAPSDDGSSCAARPPASMPVLFHTCRCREIGSEGSRRKTDWKWYSLFRNWTTGQAGRGAVVVQYGDTVVLNAVTTGPGPRGQGFLSAHLRLPRAHGGGRQVPRRVPQAGRPADHQGNAHRPADGPAHPAAVPRGVQRRSAVPGIVLPATGRTTATCWP